MSTNLSDREFWNAEWRATHRRPQLAAGDVIRRHLPVGPLDFLEIGCAPGTVMCWFAQQMGYRVAGIDFASPEITEEYLRAYGVTGRLYVGDFLTTNIQERFDVVASFGFVEHFVDYRAVIGRQAGLVKDGGYLIVQLPNLRYVNWLIYRLLRPDLLAIHNLEVMSVDRLSASIGGEFAILFCGYYKTCMLSFSDDNPALDDYPLLKRGFAWLKRLMTWLRLEDRPSRFLSPYMMLIARRGAADGRTSGTPT